MMIDSGIQYPFRVDLHVHTRRYSPCAEGLDPLGLIDAGRRQGLYGMVITEHDHLWSMSEITELTASNPDFHIFRGVEISSCNGHFLVVGIDDVSDIPAGIPVEALIAAGKARGAAVIWAHPFFNYAQTRCPRRPEQMPDGIDALEITSSVTDTATANRARCLAAQRGWARVGGSDAHTLSQVGSACTGFREPPRDEYHLAALIRAGQCDALHGLSPTPEA